MICVSSGDDALVLGQTHGSSTSADISLVLELLQILDMTDATVTLGAAGVRRATAGVLFDRGADLVLTVEEYRKAQYKELTECFSRLLKANRGMSDDTYTYVELRDEEDEVLKCWLCSDMDALPQSSKWIRYVYARRHDADVSAGSCRAVRAVCSADRLRQRNQ